MSTYNLYTVLEKSGGDFRNTFGILTKASVLQYLRVFSPYVANYSRGGQLLACFQSYYLLSQMRQLKLTHNVRWLFEHIIISYGADILSVLSP